MLIGTAVSKPSDEMICKRDWDLLWEPTGFVPCQFEDLPYSLGKQITLVCLSKMVGGKRSDSKNPNSTKKTMMTDPY